MVQTQSKQAAHNSYLLNFLVLLGLSYYFTWPPGAPSTNIIMLGAVTCQPSYPHHLRMPRWQPQTAVRLLRPPTPSLAWWPWHPDWMTSLLVRRMSKRHMPVQSAWSYQHGSTS